MNHKLFQIRSFITYWLHAVDAHSLHSPFFYDFYTHVLRPGKGEGIKGKASTEGMNKAESQFSHIEEIRAELLSDHRQLNVNDLGAGSKHHRGPQRKVSDIARHSLSSKWYACLYYRAVFHYQAIHVLELGTSLGINAMYLAAHRPAQVITMEGAKEVAEFAASLFIRHQMTNINLIHGSIDELLESVVGQMPRIDFAFIDANHRYRPTCQYFETLLPKVHSRTVLVLDDIHDNPEMHAAWKEVSKHPRVTGTADLFRCGFIFFDPSLNSQHFVLQT